MTAAQLFHVTFLSGTDEDPPETFPDAHPDGWADLYASDRAEALAFVVEHLQGAAMTVLPDDEVWQRNTHLYDRGCLGVLTVGDGDG